MGASLVAQTEKCLPAMQKTLVWFLGQEDPLEKEMEIHSSSVAWKSAWTEEPDRLQSMRLQRVGFYVVQIFMMHMGYLYSQEKKIEK